MTRVWVDADACPTVVRDILFRVARKPELLVTFVANRPVSTPESPWVQSIQVASGFDVADDEIVRRAAVEDVVITADIPLAAEVLEKGGHVLTPRGERYTQANIKQRLMMRDLMETLRASGEHSGGPPPLNHRDRKAFADQLDRLLTGLIKRTSAS